MLYSKILSQRCVRDVHVVQYSLYILSWRKLASMYKWVQSNLYDLHCVRPCIIFSLVMLIFVPHHLVSVISFVRKKVGIVLYVIYIMDSQNVSLLVGFFWVGVEQEEGPGCSSSSSVSSTLFFLFPPPFFPFTFVSLFCTVSVSLLFGSSESTSCSYNL